MKLCQNCGQHLAEEISTCPSCGSQVAAGRETIDDFKILEVLQEGHTSILCKAVREGDDLPVMIRLFGSGSGVTKKVATRLRQELTEIRDLPAEMFVSHRQIRRSSDGLWYRVSEWVDTSNWGDLVASGRLINYRTAFALFANIAKALDLLHRNGLFIPHLIPDDIMVIEGENSSLTAKIDYKLSRFINPKLDRPGPQLKHLLECHPDIIQQRPLDHRSDIWSLGRIFVQVLSADFTPCDLFDRIENLPLPYSVKTLFKTMLADDPHLRPQSMAEVEKVLSRVTKRDISVGRKKQRTKSLISLPEFLRFKFRLRVVATTLVLLLLIGGGTAWYLIFMRRDAQAVLGEYANMYAGSVAFVLVDYELLHNTRSIYRNRTEGTAFLVSEDGYLLTNRHVACPWIEDSKLQAIVMAARERDLTLTFKHRMYLWFEGQRAFSRLPELDEIPEVIDLYFLPSAYLSYSEPRVTISGVARPPVRTSRLLRSPLGDDFAVLKVDTVPDNLTPIPLDLTMEAEKIPRLSPVITLGFPLGSRTQTTHVNVSVTHGHVRRSFQDFLQVDSSIYGGNSGGPVIDTRGKVIGIASAVAMGRAKGSVPIFTALSDIGLILPITKAVEFLQDVKQGLSKWNGILDLSIEDKIKNIKSLALEGKWSEAKIIADDELAINLHPHLVIAAGIMDVCAGKYDDARKRFKQALSIDNENNLARLILYILDWQADSLKTGGYQQSLELLDWRSDDEFMGFLLAVFNNRMDESTSLSSWETLSEKSWLEYAVALKRLKNGDLEGAQSLLEKAVVDAHTDEWLTFLARSELDRTVLKNKGVLSKSSDLGSYLARVESFKNLELESRSLKLIRQDEMNPLILTLAKKSSTIPEKKKAINRILELIPENRKLLVHLAFLSAIEADWENSLIQIRRFLQLPGRESGARLKGGLLEAELLRFVENDEAARISLERFNERTTDPWYRTIADCLLEKKPKEILRKRAGENPEYLLTGYTAAGLWAEGEEDEEKAVEYYKEALGSYIDYWIEYDLALERIRSLRK